MSEVISIFGADISKDDRFFVDTNVWYWFTYCASKSFASGDAPKTYQLNEYSKFIEKVLDSGAKLFHCPLVYTELTNVIEKAEHNIYQHNSGQSISRKEFRNIEVERSKVSNEIEVAWRTIDQISNSLKLTVQSSTVNLIHEAYTSTTLDAYDSIYYSIMKALGINNIITDDKDFLSCDEGRIYTANNSMI